MPDANKFAKLEEIEFIVPMTCALCEPNNVQRCREVSLVNEAIQEGWSPMGGAAPAPGAIPCPSGRPYTSDGVMQAVVRMREEDV